MTATLRLLLGSLVPGILLFSSAGTLNWPQAWWFLALFVCCRLATALWLARTDPSLLVARTTSPIDDRQAPVDRAIGLAMLVAIAGWLALMACDARRFGWSHPPLWTEVGGAVLFVVSFAGSAFVMHVNTFAAATVRMQAERGHTVIATGPYAVVRHPMYAFMLLALVGAPLLLGSLWGLAGLAVPLFLLALRTLREERVLKDRLQGYRDYADRVRHRLIPGVW